MRKFGFFIISVIFLISGAEARAGDTTLLGTGIGAAIGGLFGSQFGHGVGQAAATGVGIAVGGIIGNNVGQSMEYAHSAPIGGGYIPMASTAPILYQAYTPNYVAPPASSAIYADAGTYCREYSQRIFIDGRWQESYGTACLQADGVWHIAQ